MENQNLDREMNAGLAIERANYRILINGPESFINELGGITSFSRLFPGFTKREAHNAVASSFDAILRISFRPLADVNAIAETEKGWDVHLPTSDVDSALYGFLVPAISACITSRKWIFVDAAAAYINNGATLLFGRGKSTTAWHLANLGVPLIAEDTILLVLEESQVTAFGSSSVLRVDVRNLYSSPKSVDKRGRAEVTVKEPWISSAAVHTLLYLDPTHGSACLSVAPEADRKSWISSLCCDRTTGRGKYFCMPYRTSTWAWRRIEGSGVDEVANALLRQANTMRLSGNVQEFASRIEPLGIGTDGC